MAFSVLSDEFCKSSQLTADKLLRDNCFKLHQDLL